MTTDRKLSDRIAYWMRTAVPTLSNPSPNQMTALDYSICRAVTEQHGTRSRGNIAEFAAVKDQAQTGRQWLPRYPMGNIAAAVMCDIYHLW